MRGRHASVALSLYRHSVEVQTCIHDKAYFGTPMKRSDVLKKVA